MEEKSIKIDTEKISNDGLQVSSGKNSFFYGEERGVKFRASGDIFTILRESRAGNNNAKILLVVMIVAGLMIVSLPLFFAILFLFINIYVSIFLFIFDFLAIITILRNIYTSYKRNRI